jgi:penicillin-binding protein A
MLASWLQSIPPEFWTGALPWLKAAFFVLVFFFLLTMTRGSGAGGKKAAKGSAYRVFFAVLTVVMALLLAYQATWQLAGFARPEFVEFMKRYNRRPGNPADNIVRGSIIDRLGVELALADPDFPAKRWYPGSAAFAHIVGYEDRFYGLAGVEAAEDATLSGITRSTGAEWQQFGRNLMVRDTLRGHDVTLTIHAALQREAHRLMRGRKGAVVMLDPRDGALLVVYSSPGFEPNKLQSSLFERRDDDARLLNRALHGLYPPGSTFKALVAAAALEQGLDPVYDAPAEGVRFGTGHRAIRDHEYYDHERRGKVWRGHGQLDMRTALLKSSNIYFARLGVATGGERLTAMAERCGFNRSWAVMQGSSAPMQSKSARFSALAADDIAKTAQRSIGQGDMLVTPLHMAVLAGVIGRGGVMMTPTLEYPANAVAPARVMSESTTKRLAGMMRYAVARGSARLADIPGLEVAGKTGTAQNPHGEDHGWFIGLAPARDARIAFAVVIEHGGFGSQSAAPVAAGLLKKAVALGWFNGEAR